MAMLDEHVDAAMDEVVSELTAGEPGAAFTARVLARIDADAAGNRTRPTWRTAWVMSPLALAAAIVVAAAVFRGGSTKPVRQPQPTAGNEDNGRSAAVEATRTHRSARRRCGPDVGACLTVTSPVAVAPEIGCRTF